MKINLLEEGFFKNPEQARAAREKAAQQSNAEKLANAVSDTILIPAVKKFLCENIEIRHEFSKTVLSYVDGNLENSMQFSTLTHPYASVGTWNQRVYSTYCDTFLDDSTTSANSKKKSVFVITDVQIVDKNVDKGILMVDLNAVIALKDTYNSNMYLYSYILLGNAGVFRGKLGMEGEVKRDLSKALSLAYKHTISKAIDNENTEISNDELNLLSGIKTIQINKIYMYRNIPPRIVTTSVLDQTRKETNVEYWGDGGARAKTKDKVGAAFLIFPMYNYKEKYGEKALSPGVFETTRIDENTLIEQFGGTLNVFDFNESDLNYTVNAYINGIYSVAAVDEIKNYVDAIIECANEEKDDKSITKEYNMNAVRPIAKMFEDSNTPSLLYTYIARMQYELKNNKLVPSKYHQVISSLLAGHTPEEETELVRTQIAPGIGTAKAFDIIHSATTGYNDMFVTFYRAFIFKATNPTMESLATRMFPSLPTNTIFPIFPSDTYLSKNDKYDTEMITIYNTESYNSRIPSTTSFISYYMPFFRSSETFRFFGIGSSSHAAKHLMLAEVQCRNKLHSELVNGFYKMFNALEK